MIFVLTADRGWIHFVCVQSASGGAESPDPREYTCQAAAQQPESGNGR